MLNDREDEAFFVEPRRFFNFAEIFYMIGYQKVIFRKKASQIDVEF